MGATYDSIAAQLALPDASLHCDRCAQHVRAVSCTSQETGVEDSRQLRPRACRGIICRCRSVASRGPCGSMDSMALPAVVIWPRGKPVSKTLQWPALTGIFRFSTAKALMMTTPALFAVSPGSPQIFQPRVAIIGEPKNWSRLCVTRSVLPVALSEADDLRQWRFSHRLFATEAMCFATLFLSGDRPVPP